MPADQLAAHAPAWHLCATGFAALYVQQDVIICCKVSILPIDCLHNKETYRHGMWVQVFDQGDIENLKDRIKARQERGEEL